jgi:hypothetical protein
MRSAFLALILATAMPAGVLIGAEIGSSMDSSDCEKRQQSSPQTSKKNDRGEQLSIKDIENMSNAGITDDKIIGKIRSTGSVFHLSSSDVQELKDAGISKRVIDYMLQTPYQ